MSKSGNITNSPDLVHEEIAQLAKIFPQFVSEGKVDLDGLSAYLANEKVEGERYRLDRYGKSKSKLIAREPSKATLRPEKDKSKERNTTENLLIEGDNLEVLKLLQNSYYKQVKCIYIDPPYNKDKDFVYRDTWKDPIENYLQITGQKDEQGERTTDHETTGRKHSNWLNMIYPRLVLAHKLLKDDGVIFISIDDDEVANLRKVLDDIFGEENFIGQWNWYKSETPSNLSNTIKKNIEYIVCYEKQNDGKKFFGLQKESASDDPFTKPQNSLKELIFPAGSINIKSNETMIEKGLYGTNKFPNELLNDIIVENNRNKNAVIFKNKFIWVQEKLNEELEKGTVVNLSKNGVLSYKKGYYSPETPPNFIDAEIGSTNEKAQIELDNLLQGKYFDYPKPIELLKYLFNFCVGENDLILDFFAGSGTTGHAVMKLNAEDGGNRKYILVQLPEKIAENAEAYRSGYRKISDITRARLEKAGEQIESGDRGFKYLSLSISNFQELDPIKLKEGETDQQQLLDRIALEYDSFGVKQDRTDEDLLFELLIRYGKPLTTEIVKDSEFTNRYKIDEKIIISLENQISSHDIQQFVKKYQGDKTIQFVCKDEAISDSDRLTLANQFPRFSSL